ncbi:MULTISPECIES: hydrophobin family protein [unclassified Streptomyces]|uniref:hydrophobin family protein n=1 Tax=unclassified Streptomyces TaxID=2593676 RepID=UPI00093D0DFE|nr:hydrophobin family protein [Streptomyces sp. TSRI0281]OKI41281.1 hypothetical protein A6A29_38095 [Streptomyces sp. TSRI0281]
MTSRLAACATAVAALSIAFGGAAHADVHTELESSYTSPGPGEGTAVTCQGNTNNGLVNIGCVPTSLSL